MDQTQKIVTMFKDGVSPVRIMDTFDINMKTLADIIVDSEEQEDTSESKHQFKHSFFNTINSEKKAYWLGFIFGDGNISSRLQEVSISLSGKDKGHLERFATDIGGTADMVLDVDSKYDPDNPNCKISLGSRGMVISLLNKGCYPNKSLTVKRPEGLPDKYIKHFIRGVVDATGGIHAYEKSASLEIVGSYDLLKWISTQGPTILGEPRPHKGIYRIRTRVADVHPWAAWLYDGATVFLDRKMKAAQRVLNMPSDARGSILTASATGLAGKYQEGYSVAALAIESNLSHHQVRRLLASQGVDLRRQTTYDGEKRVQKESSTGHTLSRGIT